MNICKFEGGGVDFFSFSKFPEIAEEHGDLVSWEPPHLSCFEKNMLSRDIHQRYPPQHLNTGVGRRSFLGPGLLAGASVDGRNPAKTHLGCINPRK